MWPFIAGLMNNHSTAHKKYCCALNYGSAHTKFYVNGTRHIVFRSYYYDSKRNGEDFKF